MHHGFHRTPLVPGCFKVLQQVFPSAAGAVQRHLSKERHSFGCASQHDWRAHADTQRRIDWKVRHGHVTSHCGPKFQTPYRTLSFDQSNRPSPRSSSSSPKPVNCNPDILCEKALEEICKPACCSQVSVSAGGDGVRTRPEQAHHCHAMAALLNLLAKRRRCNTVGRIIL